MFSQILWATDGSTTSDAALGVVRELAAREHVRITVLHVEQQLVAAQAYGYPVYVDERDTLDKIRSQAAELVDDGFDATASVVPAATMHVGAADEIAAAAERVTADLIVVGSRGHTPLGNLLLGSTTLRLLRVAPCPVLVVPPPAEMPAHELAVAGGTEVQS